MVGIEHISYAFLLGFIPTLIWVMFWLLQDTKKPEPQMLVLRAFLGGMLCVVLVLPLQKLAVDVIPLGFVLIMIWAAIEELMKLFIAWVLVLRNSAVDEPIDIPIYMITLALGFAALENTLFLITPFANGQLEHGLITGNLRFLGATLIHVVSSATIAGLMALGFYKDRYKKFVYGIGGVILAITLHTLFNFTIINSSADLLLTVFAAVWVGVMFLLLMLERVKLLQRPAWWQKIFIKK